MRLVNKTKGNLSVSLPNGTNVQVQRNQVSEPFVGTKALILTLIQSYSNKDLQFKLDSFTERELFSQVPGSFDYILPEGEEPQFDETEVITEDKENILDELWDSIPDEDVDGKETLTTEYIDNLYESLGETNLTRQNLVDFLELKGLKESQE